MAVVSRASGRITSSPDRSPLPWKKYPNRRGAPGVQRRLLKQIGRQPGVSAAGLVNNVPLSGNSGKSAATVKGHVRGPGESPRGHYSYGVDGDYFAAMGFTLREGRFLTADDSGRPERVCVVDEDFARYYWPHASALGQRLFAGLRSGTGCAKPSPWSASSAR